MAIRACDAATKQWAIWWIDGRAPHGALDPPAKGRFERGVGTFTSDALDHRRTVRTRFLWTVVDRDHLRWEQATSTLHEAGFDDVELFHAGFTFRGWVATTAQRGP